MFSDKKGIVTTFLIQTYFSCFIAPAKASGEMLNRRSDVDIFALFLGLWVKAVFYH